MSLEGTVAAVTGAGMGIGKGIAFELARQGAAVAVSDIDEALARATANEIAEELGTRTLGMRCDVGVKAEIDEFVAATVSKLGRLDAMVANAGIAIFQRALETTEETWERTMAINGRGVMLTNQAAARQMIAQGGGGAIVNIASVAALHGTPTLMAYCCSKAAVRSLTESFALDLAEHGIRVNAIAPGLIDTAIWGKGMGNDQILELGLREQFASSVPLGRMGTPADIAKTAAYLASDASEYTTGQLLVVDGGRSIGLPA